MSTTSPRPERLSAAVVALLLLGFFAWVLVTLPIQPAIILVVAGTLAWVGWVRISYANPIRSRKVIATYLCAVSFQLIHSSRPWSERSFLLTFVFGFGALWVLAAAGALYQVRIANFMLWFYALGAGLLNAVAHFVFPVLKGGYFPGLYTALGHLVLSALLLYLLVQESRDAPGRSGRRRPGGRLQ